MVKKMLKILFILFVLLHCTSSDEKSIDYKVGVTHTTIASHHYKIISTGKASEESIDSEDDFKKKFTSCQAAKDMYLNKIKQLEPGQKLREYFAEVVSQKNSNDFIYCQIILEYKIPELEKK
jgi:hypothetical protein